MGEGIGGEETERGEEASGGEETEGGEVAYRTSGALGGNSCSSAQSVLFM